MSESELKKSKTSIDEARSKSKLAIGKSMTKSMTGFGGRSMSRLKVRKGSYGFAGVPGIRPVERTSQLGIEFKRPPLVYLNTFQLDPKPSFHLANVLKEVEDTLDQNFNGHRYNVQVSTNLTIKLANDIMRRIKTMGYGRHRLIVVVTIGQKRQQCYSNALAFVWDHERDAYVNTQREEDSAFIQVTVLAIYQD